MAPMLAASAASDIFAGLDFSGIAGILLQDAGIDATQFHLFSPGFVSSRDFLEDEIRRSAGVPAGAKAARSAGIRPAQRQRRDEPTLCGGRASRASFRRFLASSAVRRVMP